MWFRSAERLQSAAEIIISDQQEQDGPYFRAVDDAGVEAASLAQNDPEGTASVDILCEPPNYLPAQLLYAFAIENALKGLLVARDPELAGAEELSKRVKTHDLVTLAGRAEFTLNVQEVPVLEALSHIAKWAGRYPVAATLKDYQKTDNPHPIALVPDALLDWGSLHPVMRSCFGRALGHLRERLPAKPRRSGAVVVFSRDHPRGGRRP
jgi:hypothetical protein